VLTGAGRAFSTGVDLDALASGAFGLADFVAWEDAMVAIDGWTGSLSRVSTATVWAAGCSWRSS